MTRRTRKISAAALGGSAATVLVWLTGLSGVVVPAEVASAIGALATYAASLAIPDHLEA